MTTMALAPEHLRDLKESGLTEDTIAALRFEAVRPADIPVREALSAYRLPYFNLDGSKNCFERLRLVPPVTDENGKKQKYWQQPGSAPGLYLPPLCNWTSVATNPRIEIVITEGEKKAAAACQCGLITAAVGGVWAWLARLSNGERLVLPMLDEMTWTGRPVLVCPDSDAWHPGKEMKILAGFFALSKELQSRGANVHFVVLPDLHGSKCGLDDWLLVPGNTAPGSWLSLQRLPLTESRFASVTAWWQKWREKRTVLDAVQKIDEEQIMLNEVAGLYTVRASNYGATLTFDRLEDKRGAIYAEMTIALGTTTLLDGVGLNLKSDTAQTKLASSLNSYAPAIPWKLLVQKGCALVLRRYRCGEPTIVLTKDRAVEPFMYAVNPLIPRKKPCILFADGGKGKSTLALAIGMAVSIGGSVAQIIALPGKSLYLDYEDDADVHTRRLQAIQAGHPELLTAEVNYLRCTEPLWRMTHDLVRTVQAQGITLVILDSLMAATAGDPSAEATGKLFATLRMLNVESLCIGHVPKHLGEGQEHPTVYGSVFNTNYARSVWELKTEQEIGEESAILGLFHRKTNLSRKHPLSA